MGKYLRENPGDPVAGRVVFRNLCAQCHTLHGEGTAVGPDLTSNGRGSFDQVLASVFDPSLVIGESYRTTTVVTEGGRNLTGLVAEDGAERVVLALPGGGREVIPRNEVKSVRAGGLSMMPEGIENLLSRRELADLFAYLALDRPPEDPQARPIPGAPGAATRAGGAAQPGSPGGEVRPRGG
jgi:putative heme-binding domain-containing protein